MITGYEIVREEAGKLVRPMLALMLVTGGVLALCGQASVRMVVSLLIGTAYTFAQFIMMGRNAARSLMLQPAQAEASLRRGYFLRYMLTGAYLLLAFTTPYLHLFAAVAPLFYPKAILLTGSIFRKKGG